MNMFEVRMVKTGGIIYEIVNACVRKRERCHVKLGIRTQWGATEVIGGIVCESVVG